MIRPSELMEAERIYFSPPPKCVLLRPPRGLRGGRERILLVFFPDFARGARRASKDLEATEQSISRRHSSEEFHRVKIFCDTFALRSVTPRISNLGFLSPAARRKWREDPGIHRSRQNCLRKRQGRQRGDCRWLVHRS